MSSASWTHQLIASAMVFLGLSISSWAEEKMDYPIDVAVTTDGIIYVADLNLPGIWKYTDGKWSVYFRGSKKFRTPLNRVRCLAIDHQGQLLAGDTSTREIYRFDDAGQPQPLTKGGIGMPMSMAVAKDGTIYAGDTEIQRLVKIPAEGGTPEIIAEVTSPRGLTIDGDGRLWVVSQGPRTVFRFSPDGKEKQVLVEGLPIDFPHHIVLGQDGEAYFADGYAKTIWRIKPGEKLTPYFAGAPLNNPVGLAWWKGALLIVDPRSEKFVYHRTPEGQLVPVESAP